MSNSIRAALVVAMASLIAVPAAGAAAAAGQGEIGEGVSRGPQPYGSLTICAGRGDAPAARIKLIRNGKVVKSFRLSGCRLLDAGDGLSNGRYKVRHTAPSGYLTKGWMSGSVSGSGDEMTSSVSRSNPRMQPRPSMSTAGFLSATSANWVTFSRTAR
jgi:hypothetical protein